MSAFEHLVSYHKATFQRVVLLRLLSLMTEVIWIWSDCTNGNPEPEISEFHLLKWMQESGVQATEASTDQVGCVLLLRFVRIRSDCTNRKPKPKNQRRRKRTRFVWKSDETASEAMLSVQVCPAGRMVVLPLWVRQLLLVLSLKKVYLQRHQALVVWSLFFNKLIRFVVFACVLKDGTQWTGTGCRWSS